MRIKKRLRIIKTDIIIRWKIIKNWYWELDIRGKIREKTKEKIKRKIKWWIYKRTGRC